MLHHELDSSDPQTKGEEVAPCSPYPPSLPGLRCPAPPWHWFWPSFSSKMDWLSLLSWQKGRGKKRKWEEEGGRILAGLFGGIRPWDQPCWFCGCSTEWGSARLPELLELHLWLWKGLAALPLLVTHSSRLPFLQPHCLNPQQFSSSKKNFFLSLFISYQPRKINQLLQEKASKRNSSREGAELLMEVKFLDESEFLEKLSSSSGTFGYNPTTISLTPAWFVPPPTSVLHRCSSTPCH